MLGRRSPPSSPASADGPGRRPAALAPAPPARPIASPQQRPVDQGGAVQRDEDVAARLDAELGRRRRRRESALRARPGCRSSCCRRSGSAPPGSPRRAGCRSASGLWMKSWSASWSVTIRLISSGIVRSKLRRPASMWATGISSLAAVSAAARVELTSPGTTTRSGRSATQDRLQPLHHPRRLLGVAARADLEHVVGRRHAELLEEDLRHQPVVVLAGVDDRVIGPPGIRARRAAITGAVLTKLGRVPTT